MSIAWEHYPETDVARKMLVDELGFDETGSLEEVSKWLDETDKALITGKVARGRSEVATIKELLRNRQPIIERGKPLPNGVPKDDGNAA